MFKFDKFDQTEYDWSRLDNTGKIFPAVSGALSSNVFRFYAKLREPVDPAFLEPALHATLRDLPFFRVKMRRGLFWYYFEYNPRNPTVALENDFPCAPADPARNSGFLFKVSFFENRVNLEVFHALADGNGAIYFLKHLLLRYYAAKNPGEITPEDIAAESVPLEALTEDAFKKYDDPSVPAENSTLDTEKSFALTGEYLPLGALKVIEGTAEVSELLASAKAAGATAGEFITACMMMAIYQARYKDSSDRRPIKISIPVNLRRYFPSETARNFFIFVRLKYNPQTDGTEFSDILAAVKSEMAEHVSEEKFRSRIRYHCELEKKIALRLVPRQIKNVFVKTAYRMGETGYTTTISNLGVAKLPEKLAAHVESGGVIMPASRNNVLKVGVLTMGSRVIINFSSTVKNTDIQCAFFRLLSAHGVNTDIEFNIV